MEKKELFPERLFTVNRVLVIPVKEDLSVKAFEIAADLRKDGLSVQNEVVGRSISSALSYADRKGYAYAIIVGSRELERKNVILRNMKLKEQREVSLTGLVKEIKL